MKRSALVLVGLVTATSAAAAQQPRRVTLAEALTLSARNAPAMVTARQNIRTAEADQRRFALGAFLPTLNANANATRAKVGERFDANLGRTVPVGDPWSEQYSLSGTLELFTGFRRGAQRRSATATVDLREAALRRQEYEVALNTKRAYFIALAAGELVAVAETRLRRAQEQLNLVTERLRLGATTRSDSLRARVEFGNAQLAVIQARADQRTAQANLGRAVGVEGQVDAAPDTTLESRLASLDTAALRQEALEHAPAIREATASVTSSRAQISVARAAYLPSLSATGANSWSRAQSSLFGSEALSSTWSVRFQMSFPIFNGFQREGQMASADAAATIAEANLRDARLLLDANLTQAFAALEAAAARIDIARISLTAAEEDHRLQRERYRLGAATIFEVLTSQVAADQAQVDLVRARYDYLVARAQLEAYVGRSL